MATHSSILTWRTPWIEEPGRVQSMGSQELDTIEVIQHACKIILKYPFSKYITFQSSLLDNIYYYEIV